MAKSLSKQRAASWCQQLSKFPFCLSAGHKLSVWGTALALHFLVSLKTRKSLPPITLLPTLAFCPSTPRLCSSTALPTSSPGDDPWKSPAVCHRSDNYIPPLASCRLLLTSHPSSLLITPWHQSLWQGSSTGHVTCQPRDMTYRARLVDKGKGDRQHKSPVRIKESDGALCRGLR